MVFPPYNQGNFAAPTQFRPQPTHPAFSEFCAFSYGISYSNLFRLSLKTADLEENGRARVWPSGNQFLRNLRCNCLHTPKNPAPAVHCPPLGQNHGRSPGQTPHFPKVLRIFLRDFLYKIAPSSQNRSNWRFAVIWPKWYFAVPGPILSKPRLRVSSNPPETGSAVGFGG